MGGIWLKTHDRGSVRAWKSVQGGMLGSRDGDIAFGMRPVHHCVLVLRANIISDCKELKMQLHDVE